MSAQRPASCDRFIVGRSRKPTRGHGHASAPYSTGQLTTCKFALSGWHTLLARAAGGRIEMYVDDTLIATWVDATPLPAYGLGLMTFDGAASFDNVKVYGLSTRSYYAFGSARVAERTTSHGQAAGSGAAPGGGWVYYLAADHPGGLEDCGLEDCGLKDSVCCERRRPVANRQSCNPSIRNVFCALRGGAGAGGWFADGF